MIIGSWTNRSVFWSLDMVYMCRFIYFYIPQVWRSFHCMCVCFPAVEKKKNKEKKEEEEEGYDDDERLMTLPWRDLTCSSNIRNMIK